MSLWGENCCETGADYRSSANLHVFVTCYWLAAYLQTAPGYSSSFAVTENSWLTWNKCPLLMPRSRFCSCWGVCALAIVSVTVSSPTNPCSVNCVCAGRGFCSVSFSFPFHVLLKQLPNVVLKVAM